MVTPQTMVLPLTAYGPEPVRVQDESAQAAELDRLRYTHELYAPYKTLWDFYLSAYEGGSDFAKAENLFKHPRENQEDYNERTLRLHNTNYCEPLVDFFTGFIFNEPVERSGGSDDVWYREFIADVNRKKQGVDKFMAEVSDDMQIFGMSYVLVDAPPVPVDRIVTKADEQAMGLRPYWVLIKPDEILDWVTDEFDTFLYVKRRQYMSRVGGVKIERYTEFYQDMIQVTDVDVTDMGKPEIISRQEFANTLEKIPLVVFRYKRSKRHPYMGISFLKDFAGNNREILNLTSLLQEFLYRQAFNILVRQVDPNIPQAEQIEGNTGTANVMEYPKDAQAPSYIAPDSTPAKFISDERSRIKSEMFSRAAQDTVNELFNGEKRSGFSQAQSFSRTVPFISSRAETLEAGENELMTLTMERRGKKWTGKVKYKDRYEITNLTDALTQLQIILRDLALPSETFAKEELKRMAREFDGKLPRDTVAKIMSDIDNMDFKEWQQLQEDALVGKGVSPGEQQKPKQSGTMAEAKAEATRNNTKATKKPKPSKEK